MIRQAMAFAAIVSLSIIGSINAQQAPAPGGIKRTPLQKAEVPNSNYDVVFGMAEVDANFTIARHTHPGNVLAYVMDGEFILGIDGQPKKTFKAGESFTVPAGAVHTDGSGDKPMKLLAVYIVERGKPLAAPAQ
jgi:quercetin dioxygenase-like cupin family protein